MTTVIVTGDNRPPYKAVAEVCRRHGIDPQRVSFLDGARIWQADQVIELIREEAGGADLRTDEFTRLGAITRPLKED